MDSSQCCIPEDPPSCPPPPEEICYEEVEDVCDDDTSSKRSKKRGRRRKEEDIEEDDRSAGSSKSSKRKRRKQREDPNARGDEFASAVQPYAPRQYGSGGGGGGQPPLYLPPPDPMRTSATAERAQRKSQEEVKGLVQCDIIALLILIAWTFALVVIILASFYYQADSDWNKVIHVQKPLPTIADENFFSGKYVYLFKTVPKLAHAKVHILREDRALEVVHITFFSLFLAFTLVQFVMYVTRGNADHSKVLIIYYGIFGGLGLIISIFPHISWTMLDMNYRAASMKLQDFAQRTWKTPKTQLSPGVSNATAYDAMIFSQICDFCAGQSMYSLFTVDRRYIDFFGRDYNIHDFHAMGFCSHHKCRSTNALMGYIFAIICCIIPCAACVLGFRSKVSDAPIVTIQNQRMSMPGQQQPYTQSLPPPPPGSTQYYDDDGNPLTRQQIKVIEKFKRYVLTDN